MPDVPPEFRFNPGKTAEIINTKNHAYYTKLNKNTIQKIREWHKQQYSRQLHTEYAELYENWNENYVLAELMEIPQNLSLQQTLNHIARKINGIKSNEVGFALNSKGKITGRYSGNESTIIAELPENCILIHNHPNGMHLSFKDIIVAIKDNISSVIATGTDKTYTINKPEKGWPKLNEVHALIDKLIDEIDLKYDNDEIDYLQYKQYIQYGMSLDIFNILHLKQITE